MERKRLAEQEAKSEDLQVKLQEQITLRSGRSKPRSPPSPSYWRPTRRRTTTASSVLDRCTRVDKYRDDLRDREEP
ncbi:hypothetical protein B0H12DRAFT_435651 [Mycena haematopus]|nr:hypothetical protein B0H12DRAFT_435651 [Mycena haematopus]